MKLDKLRNKHCSIRIVLISSLLAFSIGCSSTIKEISSDLANLEKSIKSELDKLESSVNHKSNSQKKILTEVELNSELVNFDESEILYYAYSWGKNINLKEGVRSETFQYENFYRFWHEYKDHYRYSDPTYYIDVGDNTSDRIRFEDLDKAIKTFAMEKSENLVFEIPFKKSMYVDDEDFKLDQYSLNYTNRLKDSFNYYNNNFFHKNLNEWLSQVNIMSTPSYFKKIKKRIGDICLNDLEPTSIQQKKLLNKFLDFNICSSDLKKENSMKLAEFVANLHGFTFKMNSDGSKVVDSSLILLNPSNEFLKLNISEITKMKIYLNNITPSSHKVTEYIKNNKLNKVILQTYINSIYERLFEEILFTTYYGYPPLNANVYFDSLFNAIKNNLLEGISGTKDIESRIIDSDFTIEQFDFMFKTLELVKLNDREKVIVEKYKNIVANNFDKIDSLREIKVKSDEKNKLIQNFQSAYVAYLQYKACYTSREGYMSVYITKDQHKETEKQWRLFKEASPLTIEEQEKAIIDLENKPNFGLIKMLGVPSSNYSNEMSQECSMYMLMEDRFSAYK